MLLQFRSYLTRMNRLMCCLPRDNWIYCYALHGN
jgi:hypothetical protein